MNGVQNKEKMENAQQNTGNTDLTWLLPVCRNLPGRGKVLNGSNKSLAACVRLGLPYLLAGKGQTAGTFTGIVRNCRRCAKNTHCMVLPSDYHAVIFAENQFMLKNGLMDKN